MKTNDKLVSAKRPKPGIYWHGWQTIIVKLNSHVLPDRPENPARAGLWLASLKGALL